MFCAGCGAGLKSFSKFCPFCRQKAESDSSVSERCSKILALQKLCCTGKRSEVDSFSIKWLQEKRAEEERSGSLRANQYRPDVIYWPRCDKSDPWQDILYTWTSTPISAKVSIRLIKKLTCFTLLLTCSFRIIDHLSFKSELDVKHQPHFNL